MQAVAAAVEERLGQVVLVVLAAVVLERTPVRPALERLILAAAAVA
jgi:hypothetical protein